MVQARAWLAGVALGLSFTPLAMAVPVVKLNDTGISYCRDVDGSTMDCAGSGQDGEFGRDVTAAVAEDGRAGFSYTKVCNGNQLAGSGSCLASAVLGSAATDWGCTKDLRTNLVWEVKTTDGGLRDVSRLYTDWGDGRAGDASAYVAAVNASGLCGTKNWRLPTRVELQGLVDHGVAYPGPLIDATWLPNTTTGIFHWTADGYAGAADSAWGIGFSAGSSSFHARSVPGAVRLVRGINTVAADRFVVNGAEVTDASTGLIWRRCVEGQVLSGDTCVGAPYTFTWEDALAQALAEAEGTGVAWRVPNIKELASLMELSKVGPAIDTTAFPQTPSLVHWSSSPVTGMPTGYWAVNFNLGGVGKLSHRYLYALRLVRAGRN